MLEKIPELFGRTFAVGFLLPAILFLLAIGATLSSAAADFLNISHPDPTLLLEGKERALILAGLVVIASWIFAVLLLALNRTLIRFLEGYGIVNPLRVLSFVERYAFRRHSLRIDNLKERIKRGDASPRLEDELAKRWRYWVSHFPEKVDLVLATRFGNTLRAYESYSRKMFGFDLIPGWYRLGAFIPKDYQDAMNDAKALMDFWVNLLFVSVLFLCVLFAAVSSRLLPWPLSSSTVIALIATALLAILSYSRSIAAAVERGEYYKGAVDVYLPKLYKRVKGYDKRGHVSETDFWLRYSQAIVFHAPATLAPPASTLPPAGETEHPSDRPSSMATLSGSASHERLDHRRASWRLRLSARVQRIPGIRRLFRGGG